MATQTVSHENKEALLPLLPLLRKAVIVGCVQPGCRFTASARREGRAIRSLAAHLVKTHSAQEQADARHG